MATRKSQGESALRRYRRILGLRQDVLSLEAERRASEIVERWGSLDPADIRERGKFRGEFYRNIGVALGAAAVVTPALGLAGLGSGAFEMGSGLAAAAALALMALVLYGGGLYVYGRAQEDSADASVLGKEAKS